MSDNRYRKINRFIQICLDLADIADRDRNKIPYLEDLRIGCRALSSYIRQGVKDIIDLEHDYYNMAEKAERAAESEDDIRALLDDIFGEADVDCLGEGDKAAIRGFVKKLLEAEE